MTERSMTHIIDELHALWREQIPLARHMDVAVRRLDADGIEVHAPLPCNSNHMGTAFGGSLQSVAILAGWGVTWALLDDPSAVDVVIRRCTMEFLAPVEADFIAACARPDAAAVARFRRLLALRGRAKLDLAVTIRHGEVKAARCDARYVVVRRESADG